MARELTPPAFIRKIMTIFPSRFPFEERVDGVIDGIGERIKHSRPVQAIESLQERLPVIPEQEMNTPFGTVKVPEISAPRILPAEVLDSRKKEALKTAVAIDLSSAVGMVPVVGDVASDIVEDTYGARLRQLLTTEEMNYYTKYDKLGPSTLGILRTFAMTIRSSSEEG